MDSRIYCISDNDLFVLASDLKSHTKRDKFDDIIFVTQDLGTYRTIDNLCLFRSDSNNDVVSIIVEYCTHKIICKINKVTIELNENSIENIIYISISLSDNEQYHYGLIICADNDVNNPELVYCLKKYCQGACGRSLNDCICYCSSQYFPDKKRILTYVGTFYGEKFNDNLYIGKFYRKKSKNHNLQYYPRTICHAVIKHIFNIIYGQLGLNIDVFPHKFNKPKIENID